MTNTEIATMVANSDARDASYKRAIEVSDRRCAYLRSLGEDTRNTVAWQDACYERSMLSFRHSLGDSTAGWH
jgi:hypothetical protein